MITNNSSYKLSTVYTACVINIFYARKGPIIFVFTCNTANTSSFCTSIANSTCIISLFYRAPINTYNTANTGVITIISSTRYFARIIRLFNTGAW